MKSSLTNKTILADKSNYTQGRCGYKICKITPHHMAGVLTGEQCARLFQKATRNASANYCIGVKGDIVCNVEEQNRAWTSSSKWNDCQAITIEVSNSKASGDYPISDASWKSLVNLCVDICKRYNFKLVYDGTKNGSLTRHNMYANTSCPGKYLQNKFPQLVKEVNARLSGNSSQPVQNTGKIMYVKVNSYLNVRSGAGTNYSIVGSLRNGDKVTVYEIRGNWSRIGTNRWVSSAYLTSSSSSNIKNTVGEYKILKQTCHLYSKPNLTGTEYTYLKNTKVRILKNISSTVDYIKVVKTGREAYINNKYYK